MSNRENCEHGIITHDVMCVIERQPNGSLQTAYHPIAFDEQVIGRLRDLGSNMAEWERQKSIELLDAARQASDIFRGNRDIDVLCRSFRDAVWNVQRLTGAKDGAPLFVRTDHSDWSYPAGVYRLAELAQMIAGFDISRAKVQACQDSLNEADFNRLMKSYNLVLAVRTLLQSTLALYEEEFSNYVGKVQQICPAIFEPKDYCQDFEAAYGDAALDYAITPGNQCVVEKIGEYYWACVLEHLYAAYEANGNVVAYSHRKRGFYEYKIELDSESDLHLLHETNFGFGSAVYFRSTLSYKGVSAIDASYLVFFRNVGKVAFSNCTYVYDVNENSFELCFEKATRLHSEYRELGEVAFVDKHFRKSLQDLSELLNIIASTNTFLQVTTLERLDSLTSGNRNVLLPDEGFREIEFHLNPSEERMADEFAIAVVNEIGIDECQKSEKASKLANTLLSNLADAVHSRRRFATDDLQLIVKKDLVRYRIINKIINCLSNPHDETISGQVGDAIMQLIPPDEGIYTKTYEGYDLIRMRTEKAMAAIRPIARLRKIAELTNFEQVILPIISSCNQIAQQAQLFIDEEINPVLMKTQRERDAVQQQLDSINKEIESLIQRKGDTSWLVKKFQQLQSKHATLNREVEQLREQKKDLNCYIQRTKSVQT